MPYHGTSNHYGVSKGEVRVRRWKSRIILLVLSFNCFVLVFFPQTLEYTNLYSLLGLPNTDGHSLCFCFCSLELWKKLTAVKKLQWHRLPSLSPCLNMGMGHGVSTTKIGMRPGIGIGIKIIKSLLSFPAVRLDSLTIDCFEFDSCLPCGSRALTTDLLAFPSSYKPISLLAPRDSLLSRPLSWHYICYFSQKLLLPVTLISLP